MADFWRRLLAATLVCFIVGFVAILVYSMIVFSGKTVLDVFKWDWILANTWVELLRLAPVAQAWAALLTFGWLVPARSLSAATGRHSSLDRFGSSLITLLSLALVYAIVFLVWSPAAVRARESTEFATTMAEHLGDLASRAEEDQDYGSAVSYLRQYDTITNHEDPEIGERILNLRVRAVTDAVRASAEDEQGPSFLPEAATVTDLLSRATAALEEHDYSTAHYMATLARALEPDSNEAARISAEALRHIETSQRTTEEGEDTQFFRDLLAAKHAITRGDYVTAYYGLVELRRQRPMDLDVQRYLALAVDQAGGLSLFLDDAETAIGMAEKQDLLFVNERNAEYTELIYFGAVTRYTGVVYVQRVEVLRLDPQGSVISHVTSMYGKIDNNHLILRVLDRDNPQLSQEPEYLAGPPLELDGVIEIDTTANDLMVLTAVARDVRSASIGDLFGASSLVAEHGLPSEPLQLELVLRLMAPFTYILFGLLAMGLGWRYRTRYLHHPALPTIILVPLLPVLLVPVFASLQYSQRVVAATFLLWTGQTGSIALGLAFQAVLLVLGLGYVALSTRE